MILTIYTEAFFDSAHYIKNHGGKCKNLHGHSWKVCVWVRGDEEAMDETGILWDFGNLKAVANDLDHKNLNDYLQFNPTAENLTLYIYKKIKKERPELEFNVRVYENSLSKKSFSEAGDFHVA